MELTSFLAIGTAVATAAATFASASAVQEIRRREPRADPAAEDAFTQLLAVHGAALRVLVQVEHEDGSTSTLAELDHPRSPHALRAVEDAADRLRTA